MRDRPPPAELSRQLTEWYQRPLGQRLLAQIQTGLDRWLPGLFGYHLVLVGGCWHADATLAQSKIRHKLVIGQAQAEGCALVALPEAMPLAADSVDLVILFHSLELATEPHRVLREVERVLIADGHLVIIGFNPYSLWGLVRRVAGWRLDGPWRNPFYSSGRLKDWLLLLGLEILDSGSLYFRPPSQRLAARDGLRSLERIVPRVLPFAGGVNLLVATKRVVPLTPVKPRWRPRRSPVGSRAMEPSTREMGRAEHR